MEGLNSNTYPKLKIIKKNVYCYLFFLSYSDELWFMRIKGSAFLWHQVRCMVAVLFLIGQGLESPDVRNFY